MSSVTVPHFLRRGGRDVFSQLALTGSGTRTVFFFRPLTGTSTGLILPVLYAYELRAEMLLKM